MEPKARWAEDIKIILFSRGVKKQDFEGLLWGPIDPIGTIRVGKGWAYGPIASLRIRAYPRTINKGRNKVLLRGEVKNARGDLTVSEDYSHLGNSIRGVW